ncbi:fused MFS/spermidine synthase [Myxococcus sp. MxC21-1]|uniref:spermidine synthase n=1 Tax=Myxococcus sp. MxC21-1 TaxID=3041439 RepID=UPI00292FDE5D|nr:fused MFS/spermidine synthase [Myxococcus sp. MxC21-1]WNZ61064.1 fused MFS/spermidine synthase [Myxococcus sp. MxC21-1]
MRQAGQAWDPGPWRTALASSARWQTKEPSRARQRHRGVLALARVSRAFEFPRTILHVAKSASGPIIVSEDDEGRRYLQFGWIGAFQSAMWPGFPLRLELDYTRAVAATLAFVPEPSRLLVVGLGGGTIPTFLRAVLPHAHIDAVEIQPQVLDLARRYFDFHEDEALHAHLTDGRRFIESPGAPYDVIILDAYGTRSIPPALATQEFLRATQARLTPDGVVVGNVLRKSGKPGSLMDPLWQASFPQLYAFNVQASDNRILVGLPHARRLLRAGLLARAGQLAREWGVPFNLRARVARRVSVRRNPANSHG